MRQYPAPKSARKQNSRKSYYKQYQAKRKPKQASVNDGLVQRFQMMVYPDPLPRTKEKDIAINKDSRNAAYPVFMEWYNTLQNKADEAEHGVISEHLLKYGKLIPALALIFHLVDCIE